MRTRAKRLTTATSASASAAEITTAARAACGRFARIELKNKSMSATQAAPTSPVSWLFAPDCSATAVREPLVDTAKPWNRPAARFAVPMPIISWFGSTSSPRRAAKLVDVAIVSVSDTSVIPTAATSSGTTSWTLVHGSSGVGSPCGRAPTVFTSRSNTAVTIVAPTTATSTAGTFRMTRGSRRRTASVARPTTIAVRLRSSKPSTKARSSSMKPSASVENPQSLGSWPTMIVRASPFM